MGSGRLLPASGRLEVHKVAPSVVLVSASVATSVVHGFHLSPKPSSRQPRPRAAGWRLGCTSAPQPRQPTAVRELEGRLVPEQAVYRVSLLANAQPAALAGQTWRGRVMVEAAPQSLAERVAQAALALWWREAGW